MPKLLGGSQKKILIALPTVIAEEIKKKALPGETYSGYIRRTLTFEHRIRELEYIIDVQRKLIERLEKD